MTDYTSLHISCCQALTTVLGATSVFLPGSTGYNASLSTYYSHQASEVHPQCFVTPQTAAEVSDIVKSLTNTGSCEFAVRSGGHMWFPGASNSPGGVTVELLNLDSITLSEDRLSVSVGIGATWDAVYEKLDPLNISVAGGRVAGVGVGGLTLGGGISYFGPRYGWTCNQAISFEVVLANGSIVEANENKNSELWWGLRGGSNNFGIVTRVDLATFEQGLLWAETTFSSTSSVDDQAKIYSKLMAADNYDENASFLTGWGYPAGDGLTVGVNQLVYTKPVGNGTPALYEDVLSLPTVFPATPQVVNMSTLAVQSVSDDPPNAARYLMVTTTFVPTEEMIHAVFDAFNASLPSIQNFTGVTWPISIEPLPPQIYARGAANNALGLADRTGSLSVCVLSPSWPLGDAAQDQLIYAAAHALIDNIEAKAKELGAYDRYIYLNYAAPWQDVIASYGEASVSRLQKLRKAVDPHKIFTYQVPGGFKIPS